MQNPAQAFFEKNKLDREKMREQLPEVMQGFMGLFQKIMMEGSLTAREKELVALGMAIALRCVPCINLHTKKCIDMGVTKEQVLEVASVAVMMQGGPGFTYIPVVMDAIEACGK